MKKIISLFICVQLCTCIFGQFNLGKKNDKNNNSKPNNTDSISTKKSTLNSNKDTIKSIKNLTKPDPSNQTPPSTEGTNSLLVPVSNADINADTSNELLESNIPKSLRKNNAFEDLEETQGEINNERPPLEYQKLRQEDALFSDILWEEIDAREKINLPFLYQGKEDNGDQRFFSLLIKAVMKEGITAFSAEGGDDRFTKPLSTQDITTLIRGNIEKHIIQNPDNPNIYDTVPVINPDLAVNPDSVYTYRIKVYYVFDKATSALYKRILGIAPIAKLKINNVVTNKTLFWIYYPDLRPYLAKCNVYNPSNLANPPTWEELFEGRMFSSYIVKSKSNNHNDKYLNSIYKDPFQRLLEAENIKERIYNYESDRWVY